MRHRSVRTRIGSILLTGAMLLSLLPTAAWATSQEDCPGGDTCQHMAAIGTKHYDTLAEALNAAIDQDTVVLLRDATIGEPAEIDDGEIVLDMNGRTVSYVPSQSNEKLGIIDIVGDANVTVIGNGIFTYTDEYFSSDYDEYGYVFRVSGNAELTVKDGQYKAPMTCVQAGDNSVINIEGGYYTTTVSYQNTYWHLNLIDNSNANFNVTGGTFVNYDPSCSQTENPVANFVADGYIVEVSDDIYTVVPLGAENAEASIGGDYFETLAEAIEAADGATVELLRDVEFDEPIVITDSTTIDLNKNIATYTGTGEENAITVEAENVKLALRNGELKVSDTTTNAQHVGVVANEDGVTLDLDDLTVTMSGADNFASSLGISAQGSYTGITIDMDNCVVTGAVTAVYFPSADSTLNITNSQITSWAALAVKGGSVNVAHSTLTGTEKAYSDNFAEVYPLGGGAYAAGDAVYLEGNYNWDTEIVIENSTLKSDNNYAVRAQFLNPNYQHSIEIAGDNTVVTGGKGAIFNQHGNSTNDAGKAYNESDKKLAPDVISITGGTFSTDVTDYCATGYEAVPNDPETPTLWIVEAKTGMEASTEQAGTTSSATVGGNFAPNQSAESNPAEDEGTVDTTNPVLSINVTTGSFGQPAEDVTESNVTINSEALTSVAAQSEATVSDVKIATDVGTVTLNKAAWDSIADNAKGGSVTLTIQEDKDSALGWTVTATDEDGEPVFSAENERDGEITISVPCTETVQKPEKLVVYYIGEDGQLESMVTTYEQGTLSWVTDHLSNFGGVTIGQDDEAVWVSGSTLKAGKLSVALDELDSTGGTIDLIRNATLNAARYTISGNVVIQKSANPLQESELIITTTVATGVGTGAFYISPDASLTLDGVKMSLKGTEDTEGDDGQYDGTGFILSNAESGTGGKLILNDAEVELTGFQRGFVFEVSASNLGSVELTNSKLTIQNIDGNASNGGIWTIKENSTVTVSNCGDNGLSAEVVNVDSSSVTVENTGLVGMLASQINLDNGAEVTVTGSGRELPFTSTWAPNGKQYENAVEVKKGGTLSVDSTSSVTLRDNQNQSGTSTNTILVAEGTLDNQGTIVADEIKTTAPTGYSTVTVMDGNKTLAVATIKNNEKYRLPDVLSRSGYTFLGWSDGQRTHDAKDNVTISANTTFQAVWSYNGSTSSGGSTRYNVSVEDTDNGSIRVSPSRASRGQTVTITVDPDEGYVLDRLIVRDSDGDRIDLERKSATKYTFEMPRGKVTVEATFVEGEEENVLPFRDVDVDDWFYDAVVYAYENGLMSGVSNREFAPNSTLTRAMVAQMLWAMEGKPQVNYLMQYADVGSGDWYAEAVRWASSQGIMSGYGDSQFGPNDPVTRQQLALILYNYAKEKDYDTTGGGMALREYSDYDAIADWAVTGLGWAVEHGLISGMGDGVLAPTGGATRAQVAQIFMNFCEDVAE